jgi:hypothetical protein
VAVAADGDAFIGAVCDEAEDVVQFIGYAYLNVLAMNSLL